MNYPQQPYGYPQQGAPAPAQPQYPAYPPQQAPQPQYAPPPVQGWPQMPPAPPVQPPTPLATGSIDDFFNQPSAGGGAAISWKDMPNGFSVTGLVARAIGQGDIQQDTDPQTRAPKFYRDGRPMFSMIVPLSQTASNLQHVQYQDGEARLYVRGALRDELVRAMAEAGAPAGSAPEAGARITVTLVERKPGRGAIPKNVYRVDYVRPNGAPAVVQPTPVTQPYAEVPTSVEPVYAPPAQPQFVQPTVQQTPPNVAPQYDQGGVLPQGPQQYPVVSTASGQPVVHQIPVPDAPPAAAPQPQAPAPAPQQAPADLSPEQQQLLAQLTGGQQ